MESGAIQDYQIDDPNLCQTFGKNRLFHDQRFEVIFSQEGVLERSDVLGVDLLDDHVISAIATQGIISYLGSQYANRYRLRYQRNRDDQSDWKTYLNIDGSEKV